MHWHHEPARTISCRICNTKLSDHFLRFMESPLASACIGNHEHLMGRAAPSTRCCRCLVGRALLRFFRRQDEADSTPTVHGEQRFAFTQPVPLKEHWRLAPGSRKFPNFVAWRVPAGRHIIGGRSHETRIGCYAHASAFAETASKNCQDGADRARGRRSVCCWLAIEVDA